jgi:hypothetical protein
MKLILSDSTIEAWTKAKSKEIAIWIGNHYNIPDFAEKLKVCTSVSQTRRISLGGAQRRGGTIRPYMSFALSNIMLTKTYHDYPEFDQNPVIGRVGVDFGGTYEMAVTALIVHELAHCVEFIAKAQTAYLRDPEANITHSLTGHGGNWQAIYAKLRRKFVNNGTTNPIVIGTVKKTVKKVDEIRVSTSMRAGYKWHSYSVNGKVIAIGTKTRGVFALFSVNGSDVVHVTSLQDGRGTRKWVKENLMKA